MCARIRYINTLLVEQLRTYDQGLSHKENYKAYINHWRNYQSVSPTTPYSHVDIVSVGGDDARAPIHRLIFRAHARWRLPVCIDPVTDRGAKQAPVRATFWRVDRDKKLGVSGKFVRIPSESWRAHFPIPTCKDCYMYDLSSTWTWT